MNRHHVLLNLQHHDKSSLLAGKLHASLQHLYLKGRDLFDLVWYLSDRTWSAPNLTLLNNALSQTDWAGHVLTIENWREIIYSIIETISFEQALDDVRPFLSSPEDLALLTKGNLLRLWKNS